MQIYKRAQKLRRMIDKEAGEKQASPSPNLLSSSVESASTNLFPKLKGINKPPVLTTSSQPVVDLTKTDLPTLPKMRVNGSKPKFSSKMNSGSPYNKN